MFFAFISGFLGRFSNCVSLLERVDRIGVMGRVSRYVGPIEVGLSRYPGHMSCSANESPLQANNAPLASIFHLVVVDVHKEDSDVLKCLKRFFVLRWCVKLVTTEEIGQRIPWVGGMKSIRILGRCVKTKQISKENENKCKVLASSLFLLRS
jgi:hypothetical protein